MTSKLRQYYGNYGMREAANVNLYYDIVHALQNTIDSCINSATDRRGYVLEHRFTKFSEINQCKSITPFKVMQDSTNRKFIYDFLLLVINSFNTNLLPILQHFQVTVKFSLTRGECLTLTLSLGMIPANRPIAVSDISLKN